MKRYSALLAALVFACAIPAPPLAAQVLRGVVRDSASGQPIASAVVMLLDSSGTMVARNISDERGRYRVAMPNTARSARVVRIGFQPRELRLPTDRTAAVDVAMLPVSTMLAAVRVQDKSNCPRRSDDAATFGLWEQARAGLLSTLVSREADPPTVDRLVFERRFEGNTERITRFSVEVAKGERAANSFNASFSASAFVKSGFAADSAGALLLFGPDADVLLDDAFAKAYCFRQAAKTRDRPNQVGLSFAPARHQDGRVDIDGTLWIDTTARSLSEIVFRYVGLPLYTAQFEPGGRVSFRQMTNGAVLIDRWQLRGMVADNPAVAPIDAMSSRKDLSAIEFGGELARAAWASGLSWQASLGALRVHVVTGAGVPAAGAVLALRDTKYAGTADASGDVAIADLAPGPYWLQVVDPALSDLGIWIPTPVTFVAVRDSTYHATLKVPTADEYVVGRCTSLRQWKSESKNLLVGRVTTPDGKPVQNANVTYELRTGVGKWKPLRDNFTTGADGIFQSCNPDLARYATVRLTVRRIGAPDFTTTARLDSTLTVVPVQVPVIIP